MVEKPINLIEVGKFGLKKYYIYRDIFVLNGLPS